MREIIDTEAPVGNHTLEVSCAKVEVADLFYRRTDLFNFRFIPDFDGGETEIIVQDPIDTAEVIVEMLLGMGWRPTRDVEKADDPTDAETEAAAEALCELDGMYKYRSLGDKSPVKLYYHLVAETALEAARKVSER